MSKSKKVERKRQTVDLLPASVVHLSKLTKFWREKLSPVGVSENEVFRLALRDACVLHGLEQRTDVDPIAPAGGE